MVKIAFHDIPLSPASGKPRWMYAGKNVSVREKISLTLGRETRYFTGNQLHETAKELRQPFLDFMSHLGRSQKNALVWWTGELASRSPFLSDFFLLLCYKRLILQQVKQREKEASGDFLVVVEDPWLFADLKLHYRHHAGVKFFGTPRLLLRKIKLLARGIIYRILLAAYLLSEKALLFACDALARKKEVNPEDGVVGVLGYAEEKAFRDDGFVNPYLGELVSFLKAQGVPVVHVLNVRFPLRFAKKIVSARCAPVPLVHDVRLQDIARGVLGRWKADGSEEDFQAAGMDTRMLLKRETWLEFGGWGSCYYFIFFRAMKRFFSRKKARVLIYLFENQAWEKMMCLAAKEAGGARLVGVQHSTLPPNYLTFFLGENENKTMPLPDTILTTSSKTRRVLAEGGIPESKLRVGGAWRYAYLWDKDIKKNGRDRGAAADVLVALPIDPSNGASLLCFLDDMFGGTETRFLLKTHPHTPLEKLDVKLKHPELFQQTQLPLEALFNKVDIMICSGSTIGLEALIQGKKVIRYVPENVITVDPLEGVEHPMHFEIMEGASREDMEALLSIPARGGESPEAFLQTYFDRVRRDVWLEEVQTQPAYTGGAA